MKAKNYQPWWDEVVALRAYTSYSVKRIAKIVDRSPRTIDRFIAGRYYARSMRKIQEKRQAALEEKETTSEERLSKIIDNALAVYEKALDPKKRYDMALKVRAATYALRGLGVFVRHGKLEVNEKLEDWIKAFEGIGSE